MLKFRRRQRTAARDHGSLLEHPDLQIRNLLDDPGLRRAMGLDDPASDAMARRPERRFDRRRLLDDVAA